MPPPALPFSIQVLGSGTTTPHPHRQTAAYVLRAGNQSILFDSGSGTLGRLGAISLPPHALQGIFYTHLHLDHVGDLFNLLFAMAYAKGLKRDDDLPLFGPIGFQQFYEHQCQLYGRWVENKGYNILVNELKGGGTATKLPPVTVESFTMRHSAVALGYRITMPDGRTIAYTGDADEGAELEALIDGVDLAVLDCSTLDDAKIPGHLTPSGISRVCQKGNVKRIILTHFYPPLADDPSKAVEQVAQSTGINTTAAFDGAVFHVEHS